ncbi:MAG: response regulator transcription factor [Firmicutes bacterium]|nr:response regulator transcription factor [Bacillota bacterium]
MSSANGEKILVIEDEAKIVRLLRANLESVGYRVSYALTARDGLSAVERQMPDLVVLDLMLPDGDGYSLCRRIREFSDVPVIMLTAKAREHEKIEGFHSGADDYVTKPFSSAELIERVKAMLKRAGGRHLSSSATDLRAGDLLVSFSQRRVFRGTTEIKLTHTEYNLLYHLAINAGRVMLHEELLSLVWGPEYRDELEYLRAYIRHLRLKIEVDPSNPRIILSSPGIGYSFAAPSTA